MSSAFEQEILRWKCLHEGSVVKMTLQEGAAVGDENYFPNILTIFKLLLCLPVGTCTCERSLSSLRRLKIR